MKIVVIKKSVLILVSILLLFTSVYISNLGILNVSNAYFLSYRRVPVYKVDTEENKRQPAALPSLLITSDITGINAIARAPPLMSVNSISGRLLAILKISSSTESPNCLPMMICRSAAMHLLAPRQTTSSKEVLESFDSFKKYLLFGMTFRF